VHRPRQKFGWRAVQGAPGRPGDMVHQEYVGPPASRPAARRGRPAAAPMQASCSVPSTDTVSICGPRCRASATEDERTA
jgi:hypothetical protein